MSQHDDKETPGELRQPDEGANIAQFPVKEGMGDENAESEYLVDIETHHAILVVARSVDEAAAKALNGEDDAQIVVAHDVHVCVHSGISGNECDHEEGAE